MILFILLTAHFVFLGRCPSPLKNRDFVTMRSWLPLGNDYLIINYSVKHPVRTFEMFVLEESGLVESCGSRYVVMSVLGPPTGNRSGLGQWQKV